MTSPRAAKRKASAPHSDQHHDAASVAYALHNAARIGATYATDKWDTFPIPAIALHAHDDNAAAKSEVLLAPVRTSDAETIKARGVATQFRDDKPVAWEVAGDTLESRNAKWHAHLDRFIRAKDERLGIAPSASVNIKLKKLVVAEPGALLLERPKADGRCDGAFGTLLVVLPGSFTGGDVVALDFMPLHEEEFNDDYVRLFEEDEDNAGGYTVQWRKGEPGETFELWCAAFHDCVEFEAQPIESGTAVCLVYDLVTTTDPRLIRFYGDTTAAQEAVNSALSGYFDAAQPQLAKRLKVLPEVWRSIEEFSARRYFVHFVDTDNLDAMDGEEMRIAQSLEAFCTHSQGEYVLYLASVVYSKRDSARVSSRKRDSRADRYLGFDDDSSSDERPVVPATVPTRLMEPRVTLAGPWTKFSDPGEKLPFPPAFLRNYRYDVAPEGHLERLRLHDAERFDNNNNGARYKALRELYGDTENVQAAATFALVVVPVCVERLQFAKLPLPSALLRLHTLLSKSRDEALEYATRIVRFQPELTMGYGDEDAFRVFLKLVMDIDDRQLFEQLLLRLDVQAADRHRTLWKAIEHFGFDACVSTIIKKIRTTPTSQGRTRFVRAVIDDSLSLSRIERILDVLLSLPPWKEVTLNAMQGPEMDLLPDSDEAHELFQYACRLSTDKAIRMASVKSPHAMVQMVLPALTLRVRYIGRRRIETALPRVVLEHAYELFKTMKPEIRNLPFARTKLGKHCVKWPDCTTCDEIQSFVWSTATETTLGCADDEEKRHARETLERCFRNYVKVYAHNAGDTDLHLTKHVNDVVFIFGRSDVYLAFKDLEQEVLKTLALPAEGPSDQQ